VLTLQHKSITDSSVKTMTESDTKMLVFIHELMRDELYSLMCKRGRARDGEYIKIINLSNKAIELLND
jgi:hypothetical protein